MPEMDGLDISIRTPLKTRQPEQMPLIMLSSIGYFKAELEIMEKFSAFAYKPIKPSQLLDVLVTLDVQNTCGAPKTKDFRRGRF